MDQSRSDPDSSRVFSVHALSGAGSAFADDDSHVPSSSGCAFLASLIASVGEVSADCAGMAFWMRYDGLQSAYHQLWTSDCHLPDDVSSWD